VVADFLAASVVKEIHTTAPDMLAALEASRGSAGQFSQALFFAKIKEYDRHLLTSTTVPLVIVDFEDHLTMAIRTSGSPGCGEVGKVSKLEVLVPVKAAFDPIVRVSLVSKGGKEKQLYVDPLNIFGEHNAEQMDLEGAYNK